MCFTLATSWWYFKNDRIGRGVEPRCPFFSARLAGVIIPRKTMVPCCLLQPCNLVLPCHLFSGNNIINIRRKQHSRTYIPIQSPPGWPFFFCVLGFIYLFIYSLNRERRYFSSRIFNYLELNFTAIVYIEIESQRNQFIFHMKKRILYSKGSIFALVRVHEVKQRGSLLVYTTNN